MFPASSATTPKKPGLVSRIVARPVATSGEGKGRENPCRSAMAVKAAYIMRPHSAASVARAGRMGGSIGCSCSDRVGLIPGTEHPHGSGSNVSLRRCGKGPKADWYAEFNNLRQPRRHEP